MYWSYTARMLENRAIYVATVAVAEVPVSVFDQYRSRTVGIHAAPWSTQRSANCSEQLTTEDEDLIHGRSSYRRIYYSVRRPLRLNAAIAASWFLGVPSVSDLTWCCRRRASHRYLPSGLAFAIAVLTQWMMLLISSVALLIMAGCSGLYGRTCRFSKCG